MTMVLKDIYLKPVDREIEGVIKADDDNSLLNEMEEYVLTNEIEKSLEGFLEAYNNYGTANGVWISGFFGSGKSHLLKMLAILLENRNIEGSSALGIFEKKCNGNELLLADLQKAVSYPSQSILFNIDQKADVTSKDQSDALLSVFMKVFNEMFGYYGKQPYIAEFERDMDSRGMYGKFKECYLTETGKNWETGREQVLFESPNIAKAYHKATGEPEEAALGILDKYRTDYSLSIEDFAKQVNAYITTQPKNFRLNFFVDEVGQFIAENTKLMTNLQTIAESLNTKCKGQAWILVTAQEDMTNIVGGMSRQQGNDFTKIQARFNNRLKLTSKDVSEVIQKRLLSKKDEAKSALALIYQDESNNFRTLFEFSDGSVTFRGFKDEDHFIQSYPFIPYQFDLFQLAIQSLSEHNAFEGRHSSVGERSMLGVFQTVAKTIMDVDLGQLATFDAMFEGIRNTLKAQIQNAVIQAENNLGNPFAIRLLKALFLVKYVKGFKATLRNLCILMTDDFHKDLSQLKIEVEEALNVLVQETYIQRMGDEYEYLTSEEKDVEQEIKNTEVEISDMASEMEKIIFDYIIKSRKIEIKDYHQNYPYSRKLDSKLYGREYELGIHVLTPLGDMDIHKANALSVAEYGSVIVKMPDDNRLLNDLEMYLQTKKYISQNSGKKQRESVQRILAERGAQNNNRFREIEETARELLGQSTILVAGTEAVTHGEEPQHKIIQGFEALVSRTYTNLTMLKGTNHSENDVASILSEKQKSLFGNDATDMAEAEREVFSSIQRNAKAGSRTTMKTLVQTFERKPYGWPRAAIICITAMLCARGKLEIRSNSNILEGTALEKALRNTQQESNLTLEPQQDFTAGQVRTLKEFYTEFFRGMSSATEAKSLGTDTKEAFKALETELASFLGRTAQFPFLQALEPLQQKCQEVQLKPYTWFLTDFGEQADDFLDLKEDVLDPIRKFMNGAQADIYQRAQSCLMRQRENLAYEGKDEAEKITELLTDPSCFKGNKMQQVKNLHDGLEQKMKARLKQERETASDQIINMVGKLKRMSDFPKLDKTQQAQIILTVEKCVKTLDRQTLIAVIRETLRQFEVAEYPKLMENISRMATPPQPEPIKEIVQPVPSSGGNQPITASPDPIKPGEGFAEPAAKIEYIPGKMIAVSFEKPCLENEQDVEDYVEEMRKIYLQNIRQGKRIQV